MMMGICHVMVLIAVALFLMLLLVFDSGVEATKIKSVEEWSRITDKDLKNLEREWDIEEEYMTPYSRSSSSSKNSNVKKKATKEKKQEPKKFKKKQQQKNMSEFDSRQVDAMNEARLNDHGIHTTSERGDNPTMLIVRLGGMFTLDETNVWSSVLHDGLLNGSIQATRYVVKQGVLIFMMNDGEDINSAKEFMLEQDIVDEVEVQGKVFRNPKKPPISKDKTKKSKTEL